MSNTHRIIRSAAFVCLIAVAALTGCEPQEPSVARAVRVRPAEQADPASARVRAKLQEKQEKLEFSGVPFEQVIQFLRDLTRSSIHVRWAALEAVGVNRDTPVNVKLVGTSTAKALGVILEEVGGVNPLEYFVDEGLITITTADDLGQQTFWRVYYVGDLVDQDRWTPREKSTVRQLLREALHQPLKKEGGLFGSPTLAEAYQGRLEKLVEALEMTRRRWQMEELADVIRGTVMPDSWREQSGTTGSIRILADTLVIGQNAKGHEEIVRLLAALRGEAPAAPEPPAAE